MRGKHIKGYLVKLFFEEEPKEIERSEFGRCWIDYREQLENGNIIFDEFDKFGIWATKISLLRLKETSWRYGNGFMILKTIPDEVYIVTEKKILGDKYEVVYIGNYNDKNLDQIIEKYMI